MKIFGATDKGLVRTSNEDSFFYETVGENIFFVVCDGMGGEKAGEVASKITTQELQKNVGKALASADELKEARSAIRSLIRRANKTIFDKSKKNDNYRGMGTTAVVAYVMKNKMLFMNVGDSRGYVLNESGIHQITIDHSVVEEMVRSGALTREESKQYPGRNMITMAIGTEETILPDYYEYVLKEGDLVLLCSDGLTNMVENSRIWEIATASDHVEKTVRDLLDEANKNGGKDNITAILFQY